MYSIYHFFNDLTEKKEYFLSKEQLDKFPFDENMLSCVNKGVFSDLVIRLNPSGLQFTGGEIIELKDSKSYSVSSFNSTIPTGQKEIEKIFKGENRVFGNK